MTPAMAFPSGTAHHTDAVRSVRQQFKSWMEYISAYRQYRRECEELMQLDDMMLKDIGISRVDAIRIAKQPFSEFRTAKR
jgi:uncharacterized protein YjiS (DUF1127 family)